MTTPMIKTTKTGSRKPRRSQSIDPRLLLQGKPVTYWMDGSTNPLIEKVMRAWGDNLRNLSDIDADYVVMWLKEQRIKKKPDQQPSAKAQEFFKVCGMFTADEMEGLIKAVTHREKKG